MFKKCKYLLLIILFFISCKGDTKNEALRYNKIFLVKQKALIIDMQKAQKQVEASLKVKAYDNVSQVCATMESKIDEVITFFKSAPAANAKLGDKFKSEILGYLRYMKSVYAQYKALVSAKTKNEQLQVFKKIESLAAIGVQVETILRNIQIDFAAINGSTVQ
jgi:hypothetical protein